jgi:predicted adenine nucleotide alpha hydrolase (AANH) superfamily ATPase
MLGLYRQKYCGCVYSEHERFQKIKAGSTNSAGNKLSRK